MSQPHTSFSPSPGVGPAPAGHAKRSRQVLTAVLVSFFVMLVVGGFITAGESGRLKSDGQDEPSSAKPVEGNYYRSMRELTDAGVFDLPMVHVSVTRDNVTVVHKPIGSAWVKEVYSKGKVANSTQVTPKGAIFDQSEVQYFATISTYVSGSQAKLKTERDPSRIVVTRKSSNGVVTLRVEFDKLGVVTWDAGRKTVLTITRE